MLRKSKKAKETKEKKEEQIKKPEKEEEAETEEKKEEEKEKEPELDEKKYEKPVILTAEAYKTIILYASRYANQAIPPQEWKEIYGILIGYTDEELVHVVRAEALTYGQATDVQLDTKHYIFIDEIQQKLDEEGKGYFMVGWWHSHPGLDLFFSDVDIYNQLAFQQNNPDFCGLVFDHTQLGKKKLEKIGENILTKFETGFEVYRLNDVTMDINNPNFSSNYHKIDYIVDGLNKFFFANVLSELSALVAQGKPLQSAYGEDMESDSKYQDPEEIMKQKEEAVAQKEKMDEYSENILQEIPISEDIVFNVDDFFYDEAEDTRRKEITKLKESAEQLIYEGNLAFKVKDAFAGIEKYRKGIENYKKLQEYDRVFELLSHLAEHCISTEHQNLAEQLADELFDLASEYNNLFYKAEASYLQGYLLLKKVETDNLKLALTQIQNASVIYEDAEDFAGSGRCYYKIGTIYQARLNQPFNAGLFFVQAIRSFNMALIRPHPQRKSVWAKAETLVQKILELKDVVNDLIPNIENPQERDKIKKDLDSISFNF